MKNTNVICDSCRKDCGEQVYSLDKHSVRGYAIMGDNRTPIDLCENCFDSLCRKLGIESFKEFPAL